MNSIHNVSNKRASFASFTIHVICKKLDINNSLTFQEQFGLMNSQREKKLLSSNDEKSVIDDNKKKKKEMHECPLTTDVGGFENGDKLSKKTSQWLLSVKRFNGEFTRG